MPESKAKSLLPKILIGVLILGIAIFTVLKLTVLKKPFRYAGTVEATQVDLSARLATTIEKQNVEEGDKVTKDQLLVQLSCDDVKIASKLNDSNFQRSEKLFKAGAVTQENFEAISNRKQETDLKLSWCDIKSPINGTVVTRYQEAHEWVSPGMKLISLADLQDTWAYIFVPQSLIAKLKTGMLVEGFLPELNDMHLKGSIRKINAEAEFTPKNVQTQAERTRLVFGVKIAFDNIEEILKPGMTVEVSLPVSEE